MGGGGRGFVDGRRDCEGMVNDVQGGGTDSVSQRVSELGSYRCGAEDDEGVSPYSCLAYFKYDKLEI